MEAVEPPPEDEEYDSDETVPEDPGFDLELPWFRRIIGRDYRTPYTRSKCIVHVKLSDTIGLLRAQVREVAGLSHFDLVVNGEKLEIAPRDEESSGDKARRAAEEAAALAVATGAEKERLEWVKAERARLAKIPVFDDRTLESIGVKEPPPPVPLPPVESNGPGAAGQGAASQGKGKRLSGKGDKVTPDASFKRPSVRNGAAAVGETLQRSGSGSDRRGSARRGSQNAPPEPYVPGVVIEIEEWDEALDERMFKKPESSAVLLQRAIDTCNKRWWERAADGNIEVVKELWAKETRPELLQVNWRNPEVHERTAVMACALRGQHATLRWLVEEHKARVNGWDDYGCTALNLAARGGYPKIVQFLLERKAKASVADKNGWTAAVWALTMGHLEVLQTMANFGVPLEDLGQGAPFDSVHVGPTTLLPVPCVLYRADQARAVAAQEKRDAADRANKHAIKQAELRAAKEAALLDAQRALMEKKTEIYRHRYMRDARENWQRIETERAEKASMTQKQAEIKDDS